MLTRHRLRTSRIFAAILLLNISPVFGAALTFTPTGTQLDADPILDIATTPGAAINFDISINIADLGGDLTSIRYRIDIDGNELEYAEFPFTNHASALFKGFIATASMV